MPNNQGGLWLREESACTFRAPLPSLAASCHSGDPTCGEVQWGPAVSRGPASRGTLSNQRWAEAGRVLRPPLQFKLLVRAGLGASEGLRQYGSGGAGLRSPTAGAGAARDRRGRQTPGRGGGRREAGGGRRAAGGGRRAAGEQGCRRPASERAEPCAWPGLVRSPRYGRGEILAWADGRKR